MERFMRMEGEELQAAQAQSMAADELSTLIPAVSNIADMQGELWSQNFCLMDLFTLLFC